MDGTAQDGLTHVFCAERAKEKGTFRMRLDTLYSRPQYYYSQQLEHMKHALRRYITYLPQKPRKDTH